MSISSKIVFNWTPGAGAVTQNVQRSTSLSGPWTTIASGLSAATSSYTDESTADYPFTTYYYRVVTNCSSGLTTTTSPVSATSSNCPSSASSTIFGLYSTNGGLSTQFNYYDYGSEAIGATGLKTTFSPAGKIRVVCHKCGQLIQPTGTFAQYGDISYLSDQAHIAKYLPASPAGLGGSTNNNLGSVYRAISVSHTVAASNYTFLGNGSGNTWSQVTQTTGTWNLKNHTQIRIARYIWNSTTDQTTALNALSNTGLYMAIGFTDTNRKCELYIYQATRNSNLDSLPHQLGFNITYVSTHVINGTYAVPSFIDATTYQWSTTPGVQIKFFNL